MTAFRRIMAAVGADGQADAVKHLASNYRACFDGPAGEAVLQDLADACCMTDSAMVTGPDGTTDEAATLGNVGKQAVYQHIRNMIGITDEDVERMFNRESEDL